MMPVIYIMTNQSHSTLYVDMSTVLPDRVRMYIDGEGGEFTAKYRCTKLVYYEVWESEDAAYIRERQIKGWTRLRKVGLIEIKNPNWDDRFPNLLEDLDKLYS
jgi:putative endonuclease